MGTQFLTEMGPLSTKGMRCGNPIARHIFNDGFRAVCRATFADVRRIGFLQGLRRTATGKFPDRPTPAKV